MTRGDSTLPITHRQIILPVSTEAIAPPRLRRLHDDWRQACGEADALPPETFIDPFRLRYVIETLIIVEVVARPSGAPRYRYRLVGTDLVAHTNRDVTGRWVDEHPEPELSEFAIAASEAVIAARQPALLHFRRALQGTYYPITVLVLPIGGSPGGLPTRLLVGQHYPPEAPRQLFGSAD
ncbi:MAG: hypothetical protein VW600_18595 [Ferrovibrio sp.]